MKRVICIVVSACWFIWLYLGLLSSASAATSFDLSRVRIADVVHVLYRDALAVPYILRPDVIADERLVSFRFSSTTDLRRDVVSFLDSIGVAVEGKNGVDIVSLKAAVELANEVFIYRPKYRDSSYLVEMLRPLFKGRFTSTRSVSAPAGMPNDKEAPPDSAAALIDRESDALVFHGGLDEIAQLQRLLVQVDDRQGEVLVRGVVYEVGSSSKDGSAFSLALSLLDGRVSLIGGALTALDNAVRVTNQTIDAVVSALSVDSRFTVLSSPSLRVRSGKSGSFSVGQEVPVLGAVSFPGSGQAPVQSVEYRSSGVIFELRPSVRDSIIDLDLMQQISSFVSTQTGVSGSPTLIKREVRTSLSVADGDIVVIGGLTDNKKTAGRSGLSFLPSFMRSQSDEIGETEILLVLQVIKL